MEKHQAHWPSAIPGESIASDQVDVWRVFLDSTELQMENLLAMLSPDEVQRAERFHFEDDQRKFIAARGVLREILGGYLGQAPQEVQFEYATYGKPELAINPNDDILRFNLSHSGAYALYAVTRGREIGIDIEQMRNDIDMQSIANNFFSPGEISLLQRTDSNQRDKLFFQYWTRKEAFLKATGKGVSFPTKKVDVSLPSARVLSPITLLTETEGSAHWYVQDLFPDPDYAAAIVIEGADCELLCRHYSS